MHGWLILDKPLGLGSTQGVAAVKRAITAYQQPKVWRRMQAAGMSRDFGWAAAAKEYIAIYETLKAKP